MNMLNLFLKGNISVWCESRAEMEQLRDMIPDSFSLESFEETADLKEAGFVVDNNIFGNGIRILYYSNPEGLECVREFLSPARSNVRPAFALPDPSTKSEVRLYVQYTLL